MAGRLLIGGETSCEAYLSAAVGAELFRVNKRRIMASSAIRVYVSQSISCPAGTVSIG